MESNKDLQSWLDRIIHPAFTVSNMIITQCNAAAAALLLAPGLEIATLLSTDQEELTQFHQGCLYCQLTIHSQQFGAAVTAEPDCTVWILDDATDERELRALSLAAQMLRAPLNGITLASHAMQSALPEHSDAAARMNRSIAQMLRLIGNMSDAYSGFQTSHSELQDMDSLFSEIFEKSAVLLESAGYHLQYTPLQEPVLSAADRDSLERAVFNILSNAVKFSPKGSTIHCCLMCNGNLLLLQIQDAGSGIAQSLKSSFFTRYQRQPGMDDSAWGLGLGMVLVRNAAKLHRGTVLVDEAGGGTRVTLTLPIQQSGDTMQSPILRVDYTGERDHALVELADILPPELYR